MFSDLLDGNARHLASFTPTTLSRTPRRGLAIVTCMDSRVDPLRLFGLEPGDAMVLRNAGARVSEEALKGLAVAIDRLGVKRVAVMHHTDCQSGATLDDLRDDLARAAGLDVLHDIEVAGFVVDVTTDVVTPIDDV
jgi:carbonic anhydrase